MDFLPTKGIEYLVVLSYLALLVPFWWLLTRGRGIEPVVAPVRTAARSWFVVPEGFHFHRGHGWAKHDRNGLLKVGMDDFSLRLVGHVCGLELPPLGCQLRAGESGWAVEVNGTTVPVLAPVSGEVVEVNEEVIRDPSLLAEDPYHRGWLLRVANPASRAALVNLMPSFLARTWIEQAAEDLTTAMSSTELGTVLQDGGMPLTGLARAVAGEGWLELVSRLLLTEIAEASKPEYD